MRRSRRKNTDPKSLQISSSQKQSTIEALVHRGIEDVAERELTSRLADRVTVRGRSSGRILFDYTGALEALLQLQTVTSLYLVMHFDVPRPRALLGDEHLRRLLDHIGLIIRLAPPGSYSTMHISAAGATTPVMRRLTDTIAVGAGLRVVAGEGDLHLRVRRPANGAGWEVLLRLSPRPLSARRWRVCNMPGAMNAAVAAAMVLLTEPNERDRFLNPCCGSGTIVIERAAMHTADLILGCDITKEALSCARENIMASGYAARIEAQNWDAQHLPIPDASVDAICVDLPFGHVVGSHALNQDLHAEILREVARVAAVGARCCLLTHQASLMDGILRQSSQWITQRRSRVELSGLAPTLFLLRRRGS